MALTLIVPDEIARAAESMAQAAGTVPEQLWLQALAG